MGTIKLVAVTFTGIMLLGAAIFSLRPPQWEICELVMLAAGLFVAHEYLAKQRIEAEMRRTRDPSSGGSGWNAAGQVYARARSRRG